MQVEVIITNGVPVVRINGDQINAKVSYPNNWDTVVRFDVTEKSPNDVAGDIIADAVNELRKEEFKQTSQELDALIANNKVLLASFPTTIFH